MPRPLTAESIQKIKRRLHSRRVSKEVRVKLTRTRGVLFAVLTAALILAGWWKLGVTAQAQSNASGHKSAASASSADRRVEQYAQQMVEQGRQIFRYDTFGSEAFWGDAVQLHRAIAGERHGGVGDGVSPKTALSVGLKVDADALPDALKQQIKDGKVNLDDPATTLALLKLDAVVGVKGFFDAQGGLKSIGLVCASC